MTDTHRRLTRYNLRRAGPCIWSYCVVTVPDSVRVHAASCRGASHRGASRIVSCRVARYLRDARHLFRNSRLKGARGKIPQNHPPKNAGDTERGHRKMTNYTGVKMSHETTFSIYGEPTNYLHGLPYDAQGVKALRANGWQELQPNHLSQQSFGRRAWYRRYPGRPCMVELLSYETLAAVANTDMGIGWILWDGVNAGDGYGGGTWGEKPSATTRKHIKEFFAQFAPENGIISWDPKSKDYPSQANMVDRLIERARREMEGL